MAASLRLLCAALSLSTATALRLPAQQPPAATGRRDLLRAAAAAATGLASLAAPAQAGLAPEYTKIQCAGREDTECLQRKREAAKAALFAPKAPKTAEEKTAELKKANECGPLTCGTALAIKCDRNDLECLANKRKVAQEGINPQVVVAVPVFLAGFAAKNAIDKKDGSAVKAALEQKYAERREFDEACREARAKGLPVPTAFEVNAKPGSARSKGLNK